MVVDLVNCGQEHCEIVVSCKQEWAFKIMESGEGNETVCKAKGRKTVLLRFTVRRLLYSQLITDARAFSACADVSAQLSPQHMRK